MAEFPALPLWTDAYLGDTTHLTTIEHGAYLLLLMTAWRTSECRLPDDDRLLARYARMSPIQWKRMRPAIAEFFTIDGGFWTQGRLTDEREAVKRFRESCSTKGKAGAAAKALKNKERHKAGVKSGLVPAKAEVQPDISSLTLTHKVKPKDKSLVKKSLPDDFEPTEFGEKTQSRPIVDSWSRLEFERQLERFRAHHRKEGSRCADWQSAWSTWVLNSVRFDRGGSGGDRGGGSAGGSSFADIVLAEHSGNLADSAYSGDIEPKGARAK